MAIFRKNGAAVMVGTRHATFVSPGEERERARRADKLQLQEDRRLGNLFHRSQRGPKQQLDVLDKRLGKDKGAVKERNRLTEAIAMAEEAAEKARAEKAAREAASPKKPAVLNGKSKKHWTSSRR